MKRRLQNYVLVICFICSLSFTALASEGNGDNKSYLLTIESLNTLRERLTNPSFIGLYDGEKLDLVVKLKNEKSEAFKGQYGIGLFKTNGWKNSQERDITYPVKPESVVYVSKTFELAFGGVISETIRTNPIVNIWGTDDLVGNMFMNEIFLFPVVRTEGGEWEMLFDDSNDDFYAQGFALPVRQYVREYFMQDDLLISELKISHNDEFTVYAEPACASDPEARFQVSLYKQAKIEGTNFAYNKTCVARLDYKRKGDIFYCNMPDDIAEGQYELVITPENVSPDYVYSYATWNRPDFIVYSGTPGEGMHNRYRYALNIDVVAGIPTGIDANAENGVKVYVDKASDILQIEADETLKSVELFDMMGKCAYRSSVVSNSLPLAGYNKGVYIVRLVTDKGDVIVKKILVD